MELELLKKVIAKGQIAPVYVLHGEEDFYIRESLSLLRSMFLKGSDATTSLIELDGKEATGPPQGGVFDELRTIPLFGATGKRMVIVENADDFVNKHRDLLEKYLDAHTPYSCLVLVCKKLDKKTKFAKKINKIGGEVECHRPKDYQLSMWIPLRAKHYGKTITPQAVQSLIECVGNKPAIIDKHLEKLSIYLDNRTTIQENDIENLVSVNRTRSIFELTEAMAQKNTEKALKVLDQLLAAGEESVKIMGMLAWQIRRLWQAKHILSKGGKAETVASELGIKPFFLGKFIKQTEQFTEASLQKKHEHLLLADFQSKTTSVDGQLLLECLVCKLCR